MTAETIRPHPVRVFISYAWTAQEWAKILAERLIADGIDVRMDIYDLKPGQDKFHFMESMILDRTITKVLMLCDQEYMKKADSRTGGVGDEAQILTPEIYKEVEQNRIIPIIRERDEQGNEYTPQYLKTRIYIDLSDSETYEENYVYLVREIYNKPIHIKPPLGNAPSYIIDENKPQLPTMHKFNAFRSALLNSKAIVVGLADDFLYQMEAVLTKIQIELKQGEQVTRSDIKEQILDKIKAFLPLREQFIDFITLICKYGSNDRLFDPLQQFFVRRAKYLGRSIDLQTQVSFVNDSYQFVVSELFLYTIAIMIRYSLAKETNIFLGSTYQSYNDARNGEVSNYEVFEPYMENLDLWEQQSQSSMSHKSISMTYTLLKDRVTAPEIAIDNILGVDYALFMRQFLRPSPNRSRRWNALITKSETTYLYANGRLSLFAYAASHNEFRKLCHLLDVEDKSDLLQRFQTACNELNSWNNMFNKDHCARHRSLMNIDNLDTM